MKKLSLLLVLVLLLGAGAFGLKTFSELTTPVSTSTNPVEFEVVDGATVYSVLAKLESAGIIKSELASKVDMKISSKSYDIKVGTYTIDSSWTYDEILTYLSDSSNAIVNSVRLTFKEGIWAKEIAEEVAKVTSVSAGDLLAYWNNDEVLRGYINQYEVLTDDILQNQAKVKLEGYLFPQTYDFYVDTTVEDITKVFLDECERIYQKYKNEFDESEYSIHELFTLASIIQFESGRTDEMPTIASVFYNRLDAGMLLQSSVTVCYSLYEYDDWKSCELNSDIDNPYNTYLYAGLPPGPITSSGEAAIAAVLNPETTDYYYFIADVYGDGSTIFAKTLAEHNENVRKYLN